MPTKVDTSWMQVVEVVWNKISRHLLISGSLYQDENQSGFTAKTGFKLSHPLMFRDDGFRIDTMQYTCIYSSALINRILILFALVLSSACANNAAVRESIPDSTATYAARPVASTNRVESESARLNQWFEDKYAEELAWSPITLTNLGSREKYDQIDDFSEKAADDFLRWQANTVAELKAGFDYGALGTDDRVSYDLWVYRYESALPLLPYRRLEYLFTQMNDPHAWLPNFLINQHLVESEQDMQAYIRRIGGIAHAIDQLLERARVAAGEGVRPPRFAYENVISVSRNLLDGAPFDTTKGKDTPLWSDASGKIAALLEANKIDQPRADKLLAETRLALLDKFLPAYTRLIYWFEKDLVNVDQNARGVSALPNGATYYELLLKNITNTGTSAEQIHQTGLREVARIRGEMERIKQQVGFTGTLEQFFATIRGDKRFLYPDTDEGRAAYLIDAEAFFDMIRARLPDYFGLLPRARLVVKRVESFREQDGAPQHYQAGTKDGSRPGIYYVHLSDMASMSKTEMEAIAYHEGIPGHHLQIAIARELENIPEFRTVGGSVSYTEGWALYAEYLSKEMGAYKDPYSDFGRLMTEIWRAVRMVVDTGIHAKGWTEQQAFNYFRKNSPKPDGQIRNEIQRYFSLPGQATSYKTGMLKILELRARAEAELGERFDIREFHDVVLGNGFVPLTILERLVDDWIRVNKAD